MSLLVSDFDGTFLTKLGDIDINCRFVKDYIKRGNYFMLSSGRPYDSILEQIRDYRIPFTHIGASDGNFLLDTKGNVLQATTMRHDIIGELDELRSLDIYENIQFAYPKFNWDDFDPNGDLGSVAFVVKQENVTPEFLRLYDGLKERHDDYQFDVYGYDGTLFYMVRPKGINKGTHIAYLERKLEIPKQEIYTIGDNTNDFEMIRDYNGYRIGDHPDIVDVALQRYDSVYQLIDDINKKKALKRW